MKESRYTDVDISHNRIPVLLRNMKVLRISKTKVLIFMHMVI